MPIIKWDETCQTGVQEIDRRHRRLVDSVNKTYDQFRDGKEIDQSFLNELLSLSSRHFSSEERRMRESGYPFLSEHQEEHAEFIRRICQLSKEQRCSGSVSVELLWFLCNWVTRHVQETDAEFGRFLAEQKGTGLLRDEAV